MTDAGPTTTSRRVFLRRATLSLASLTSLPVISACSSGDIKDVAIPVVSDDAGPLLLRNAFPDGLSGGKSIVADTGAQRAIFALQQDSRYLQSEFLPSEVSGVLTDPDGVDRPVTLAVRSQQIPLHYLSLIFEPTGTGVYVLTLNSLGYADEILETQFVVAPIDEVPLVHPGMEMPRLDTPTNSDPQDMKQLCTRSEECGLHELSVAEALDAGLPFALMVSSPAFCTTGICGPTLEILLTEVAAQTGINFIHVEVYSNPAELGVRPRPELVARTLNDLGMTFEPSMIVVGADGKVRSRLDASMDQHDIRAAIASAFV